MILITVMVFSFTACTPGDMSTQSLDQTTFPPAETTTLSPSPEASPSSTYVPTRPPRQSLAPTQTPTHTQALILITPTPAPTSTDDLLPDEVLPDLQTLPPTDLRLLYDADTGRALIRFTNSIWNSGPGKLELIGIHGQNHDQVRVSQRVFTANPEVNNEYETI